MVYIIATENSGGPGYLKFWKTLTFSGIYFRGFKKIQVFCFQGEYKGVKFTLGNYHYHLIVIDWRQETGYTLQPVFYLLTSYTVFIK